MKSKLERQDRRLERVEDWLVRREEHLVAVGAGDELNEVGIPVRTVEEVAEP
jgi:hypothetical protein